MTETAPPRRIGRIVAWTLGLLLGLPVALVLLVLALVLIVGNTGPGRRLIETQAASLTGGLVRLQGLGGRFPDALTAQRIDIDDSRGTWLSIDHLVLDWSPLRLLAAGVHVELAGADRITVSRLPVASPAKPSPPPKPGQHSGLHLAVLVDRLVVRRLDVAPAATGAATGTDLSVAADGHVRLHDLAPILDGASLSTLPDTDLALTLTRLDHPGSIALSALVTPGRLGLHTVIDDPAGGFTATLAHLPELSPLRLNLDLDGPRDHAALALAATAGTAPLTLSTTGTLDLLHPGFDLRTALHAPAMQPVPGIGWSLVSLDAHLLGSPGAPAGQGHLVLDGLAAGGASVAAIDANFAGAQASGPVTLHATASGITLPGPRPALLQAAPLVLDASLDPHQAMRPLDLRLSHPLLSVSGQVMTAQPLHGALAITLPDLSPLAAAGGIELQGHAAFHTRFSLDGPKADLTLAGPLAITGGQPQAAGLIGPTGQLRLDAGRDGSDLTLRDLRLDGQALHLTASGTDTENVLAAQFSLLLPKLEAALPTLRGALSVIGTASGPMHDLAAHIEASGTPGTATMPTGPLRLVLDAQHLLQAPQGRVQLTGSLDRSPITLTADAARQANGALHLLISALDWKSAAGTADLVLASGAKVPVGNVALHMTRLADLAPLLGQKVAGRFSAKVQTSQSGAAPAQVAIDVQAQGGMQTASVSHLSLRGQVRDPIGAPSVDLALDAGGIRAGSIEGDAQLRAHGPQTALDVTATARLHSPATGPASLDTALRLDLKQQAVALSRLQAAAKGLSLHLDAPARIAFGATRSVDHLRLSVSAPGAGPATIAIAGTLSPRLALDAQVDNLTPALARTFAPTLDAAGVLAATVHLTGSLARPQGEVRLTADGVRLRTGPASSLPPASLRATAMLDGGAARLNSALNAGPDVALTVRGTAPLNATGPLDLHAAGNVDLRLANAILGAQGRALEGRLGLDMQATGSAASPSLSGTLNLADGQFQDFAQGVRLTRIAAQLRADGKTITIDRLDAHAGDGSIGITGSVGALAPGIPVDLHIVATKARPLTSDLLTATLDADLRIHGAASSRLDVGGSVTIDDAAINIPSGLPPSVAQLNVIRPGQKPAATAETASLPIGLDIALNAPGQIFVRGHGLDAELGGMLHVGGTAASPQVGGGFDLRRGTFDLAGISLTFTKGEVGFNGAGIAHRIDPSLDFVAQSIVGATVAQLNVGGYASAPKISLSSTPPLPQDQILALILFGQDLKSLSPLQIAQIASALASLTGSGGGFDPLGTVRKSLGLDRLSIGSGSGSSSGASVEAGKYVARGVYVGAKQATSGGGTQAQVQIDLTRRLKLLTTVGTGGATTGVITPENDPGSSVALKYQFQY